MKLSKLKREHSKLKYLFPFQSHSQLTSFVFFESCGLLLIAFLLKLDPNAPMATILFFAAIGGAAPLYATLPASFEIASGTEDTGNVIRKVEALISRHGFSKIGNVDNKLHYQSKLPKYLRWEENEIYVSSSGSTVKIIGPLYLLKIMYKQIQS